MGGGEIKFRVPIRKIPIRLIKSITFTIQHSEPKSFEGPFATRRRICKEKTREEKIVLSMDTRSCFIAFIVGYCLSFGNAEISDFFGAREMEAIKLSATATLSHPATLGDAYFSAKILRSVDTAGYSCNCAAIDKLFNQASSNLDIYYGVASSQACSCNLEVSSNFKSDAINGLKVTSCFLPYSINFSIDFLVSELSSF